MKTTTLPTVIEPFSTFGDEVAGSTAEEIAHNLAAATRTSLAWRCKLRRPCPDVPALFAGHPLSLEARRGLQEVIAVYARHTLRQQAPVLSPEPAAEPTAQLALL